MPILHLSQFKPKQAIVEWRYPPIYEIWDKAGVFWDEVTSIWPSARMKDIKVSNQVFIVDDRFYLTLTLDRASLIDLRPDAKFSDWEANAEKFFSLIKRYFPIIKLNRMGCRIVFRKEYPSSRDASDVFAKLGLSKSLQGKIFNIEGAPVGMDYAVKWEDEVLGAIVKLNVVEEKIELELPPEIDKIDNYNKQTYGISYDVDVYTKTPLSLGQIIVKDWIKQCVHVTRRDSEFFLGGG